MTTAAASSKHDPESISEFAIVKVVESPHPGLTSNPQAAKKKRKAAEKQAKAKEPEKKWKAGGAGGGAAGRGGTGWACMTCTFVNSTSARCRCGMCGQ